MAKRIILIVIIAVVVLALAYFLLLSPWKEDVRGFFANIGDMVGDSVKGVFS